MCIYDISAILFLKLAYNVELYISTRYTVLLAGVCVQVFAGFNQTQNCIQDNIPITLTASFVGTPERKLTIIKLGY